MLDFDFIDISPCGKFHLLQGWWKAPAILSCVSTCVHIVGQQILQKLLTGEEIVKESMMVFSMQFRCVFTTLSPRPGSTLFSSFPV